MLEVLLNKYVFFDRWFSLFISGCKNSTRYVEKQVSRLNGWMNRKAESRKRESLLFSSFFQRKEKKSKSDRTFMITCGLYKAVFLADSNSFNQLCFS